MKSLLIILSHSPLSGQNLLESLSAAMVMATYGVQIQILLTGDAIELIRTPNPTKVNTSTKPFKSPWALVESFQFYDLLPIWIDQKSIEDHQILLEQAVIEHEMIDLNTEVLSSFDGVLRW
jgi:sulfur relay (sulfurtransferase) DsrF/TusC family protein